MIDGRQAPVTIELECVSAVFQHERRRDVVAVRNLELSIRSGELLTLLGPSGCGKTTTLRMIAGFQEPSAGRILIQGQDVTHLPPNRRDIGVVFQSYALFPHLSVFENVAYGLRARGHATSALLENVHEALGLVGLSGFGDRQIGELSGGQQQRVALARATVIRPRVLLFDEPLSNLDAKLRVQVREEIAALQQRLGITTVYVTHDQEEAMAISSRIAIMEGGRIAQLGTAEELYRRPTSDFVAGFLGRADLVAGTIRTLDPGRVRLTSADGTLDLDVAEPVSHDESVRAVLRPEAIQLRAPAPGDGMVGTVLRRIYLGEKVEYVVQVGRTTLRSTRSDPDPDNLFEVGMPVSVEVSRGQTQLLAEGGA